MNDQVLSAGIVGGAWAGGGLLLAQAAQPLTNEVPAWLQSGGIVTALAVLAFAVKYLIDQLKAEKDRFAAAEVEHVKEMAAKESECAKRIDLIRQSQLDDRDKQLREIDTLRSQYFDQNRELLARVLGASGKRPIPNQGG